MSVFVVWMGLAGATECDVVALTVALEDTEAAMEALDPASLSVSATEARDAALCATEAIGPDLAARLYRGLGVFEYVSTREPELAAGWFRAARATSPGLSLSPSLAGPVQAAFDAVEVADPRTSIELAGASLLVDGSPATDVPTERPYLMQWLSPDGALQSGLVTNGVPLAPPFIAPIATDPMPSKKNGKGLLIGAGVAGGAAVASLVGALAQNPAMRNASSLDGLDAAYGRQRVFAVGFWGLAATATGLGVAHGVTR